MRIAVIASQNIPSLWAHGINTVKHAQGFKDLNHSVEILIVVRLPEMKMRRVLGDFHELYDINKDIKVRYFVDHSIFFFEKMRILGIIINHIFKFFPRLRYLQDPEKKISKYCKKEKVDLAYCRTYRGAYYCILNKIPTVLETHTPFIKKPDLQKLFKLSKNEYFRGIITIHELLKESYIEAGVPPRKILVLEDAVDLSKFDIIKEEKAFLRKMLKIPSNKKIITYCGSLKPGKGINQIFRTAKNFDNSYLFCIVGGEKRSIRYWKRIVRKNKINNIKFTGFVKNKLVPYYLKSSDILLMLYDLEEKSPLIDINTTSPIKLFEYMASKRPIVCTKLPTIEKIVQHKQEALLSEWDDIDDVVKNVQLLLENKQLANKISQNAYEKVQNYTYTKRCKKILEQLA